MSGKELSQEIVLKKIDSLLVVTREGKGRIPDFNRDVDQLYEYIYARGFGEHIVGPTIGLFHTEDEGKYVAAVPIDEEIPVEETITIERLPAITATSLLHTNGDETIDESFARLKEYRKQHHMEWVSPVREIYIPTGEEGKYYTEIQVPVT